MTHSIAATPVKLRSGDWGARIPAAVADGDIITITTRAGKSWQARVTSVVWHGQGASICTTASLDLPASSSRAASGCCVCRAALSAWERQHGVRRCADCRDGGSRAHGGQSYYDRSGNFVLGDDD
jgi:hypothetical protein